MKFGKRLLEELMEPGWEAYYVDYYVLKKLIVQMVLLKDSQDQVIVVDCFWKRLDANILSVECFAQGMAAYLVKKQGFFEKAIGKIVAQDQAMTLDLASKDILDAFVDWQLEVQSVFAFCQTNRTAVVKITKKFEKSLKRKHTPRPFRSLRAVENQLLEAIKVGKQLESSLMYSINCMVQIRTRKAAQTIHKETRKLRRVEHFERELIRPLLKNRHEIPDVIYMEWRPVLIIVAIFVLLLTNPKLIELAYPFRKFYPIVDRVLDVLFLSMLTCGCLIQHLVIKAKLQSVTDHRNSKKVLTLSLLCLIVFVLMCFCADFISPSIIKLTVFLHLSMETFLDRRFELSPRFQTNFKLANLVLFGVMASVVLKEEHELAFSLAILPVYFLPSIPEFSKILIQVQVRKKVNHSSSFL